MSEKSDKLKSEFEEKLRQSHPENPLPEPGTHQPQPAANPLSGDNEYASTIPVIEERVHVDKEIRETGQVHIEKQVHREEVALDLPTIHEEANIERVAVNQYVDTPPPPVRHEGDKMIIPVLKEVLVVEKRILVVEELHITKNRTEEHHTEHVELRREEIRVERKNADPHSQAPGHRQR